ncbi:MAG: hypothetical protein IPI66_03390 [Chitinophagaceae bacterium]|nr:hypothetical protein [Chitinophagaceae bacterium]
MSLQNDSVNEFYPSFFSTEDDFAILNSENEAEVGDVKIKPSKNMTELEIQILINKISEKMIKLLETQLEEKKNVITKNT